MSFTLVDCATLAKSTLGQAAGDDSRYPTSRLLEHGVVAIERLSEVLPKLFTVAAWMQLTQGSEQTVPDSLSCRELLRVTHFKYGNLMQAARPIDVAMLAAYKPNWVLDPPALPKQWALMPEKIDRFVVYPPAIGSSEAYIWYRKNPVTLFTAETGLPDSMRGPIADYMVGMAEMADEEHVNSNRAAQMLAQFAAAAKVAAGIVEAPPAP